MKAQINLNKSGGPVSISITFGMASIGRYQMFLYDATDLNPQKVLEVLRRQRAGRGDAPARRQRASSAGCSM